MINAQLAHARPLPSPFSLNGVKWRERQWIFREIQCLLRCFTSPAGQIGAAETFSRLFRLDFCALPCAAIAARPTHRRSPRMNMELGFDLVAANPVSSAGHSPAPLADSSAPPVDKP